MATKDDHPLNDPKLKNERGLNRRDFVKTGVAAGLGSGLCYSQTRRKRKSQRLAPKKSSGTMR